MPELPEVQTTVNGLKKTVVGLTISDVWSDLPHTNINRPDYKETIKYLPFFKHFQKNVCGKKIISVERRAKNILINLSGGNTLKSDKSDSGKTILIHMKMTGHMMYGSYTLHKKENVWAPSKNEKNDALRDPFNRFLHVVFSFTNGKQLVLSDVRKFAKVTLLTTHEAHKTKHLDGIGPEPLENEFTFEKFLERVNKKPSGKIKSVLMDQGVVAGVGNIYSDEALWLAAVQPTSIVSKIPKNELKNVYKALIIVLKKGIDFGGDSTSDYRRIDGSRGEFSANHNAYRLTNTPCRKKGCKGVILRTVVGGRSAHFCNTHQRLFK